jgi:hypothetical protein
MSEKQPFWLGMMYSAVIVGFSLAMVSLLSSLMIPVVSDLSWQQEMDGLRELITDFIRR